MTASQESMVEMSFPSAGLELSTPFSRQTPRQLFDGVWARTTPRGVNVRGYEALTGRRRGGSRTGLVKYLPAAVVAGWIVQQLDVLVGVGYSPPGGHVQLSNSGRIVTLVAVSQGNVYVANPGDTIWSSV